MGVDDSVVLVGNVAAAGGTRVRGFRGRPIIIVVLVVNRGLPAFRLMMAVVMRVALRRRWPRESAGVALVVVKRDDTCLFQTCSLPALSLSAGEAEQCGLR